MTRVFTILWAGLVLAGCSSGAEERAAARRALLDGDRGKSIADVSTRMGPPASRIDTGAGLATFQWVSTRVVNTGGSAMRIPGTTIVDIDPGQQIQKICRINFMAATNKPNPLLSDWIIQSWSVAGNDCGIDAAR